MLFDLLLRSVAEEEQIDGEIWPPSGSCFLLSFHGAPESVGLVSCLQDVGAVGDTVEEGLAEAGVGEDRRPLRERQVGGDDDGGLLCPIGDDLEEHLGSDLGQGNVAHLIEGDQVPLLPSGESAAELAVVAGFDEFVDESGDGGESDSLVLAACFDTECGHQVSLAGAGVAKEDDRLGAIQIAAVGKRTHLGCGDAGGVEIEVFQGLGLGQFCFGEPPGDPALQPFFDFGGEQGFEIAEVGVSLARGLFGDAAVLSGDGGDTQGLAMRMDRSFLERGGNGTHRATSA